VAKPDIGRNLKALRAFHFKVERDWYGFAEMELCLATNRAEPQMHRGLLCAGA
jgi:hypothetical protein